MMNQSRSRWSISGYFWIFLAALGLRYGYLWEALRHNELLAYPLVDARVYVDWAREIMGGQWLWYETRTYTPGVPLWLAGWFTLLGDVPWMHFAVFHLIGACQAVLLGKTAENLWGRKTGFVTGWIAALYWPFILFEATYYAEPLACFALTLTAYFLTRWRSGQGGTGLLLGAGFTLGWAILARSNTMLCAPVLALWVYAATARRTTPARWGRALVAPLLLAIPSLAMCAPIVFWNWKLNQVAELRTGGWLSVYLGNNPEYRALVVPVGVRWSDFVYQPIRAGQISRPEQNEYWRKEVFRVVGEQTYAWSRLMERKAMMLLGRFEVSQEIDIQRFRAASRLLNLPIWPDWAVVLPLALLGLAAMAQPGEIRRGWPLLAFALLYLLSVAPVQAAGRYRMPTAIPLIPIAGWILATLLEGIRRRAWVRLLFPLTILGGSIALVAPDWLLLREEKIVNHYFHLGLKRSDEGDLKGAKQAFADGAAWNPSDPDCPYQLGRLALKEKNLVLAETYFRQSLSIFPRGYEPMLGLAETALAAGKPEQALQHIAESLKLAPNNLDALGLAVQAHARLHHWNEVVAVCGQMRTHLRFPASVSFTEARALVLAGRPTETLPLYDDLAGSAWRTNVERSRARFLSGLVSWRIPGGRPQAMERWKLLSAGSPGFFQLLGQTIVGGQTMESLRAAIPPEYQEDPHFRYTAAVVAIQRGAVPEAVENLEAILAKRNARHLPVHERDLLEIWAIEDLDKARPSATAPVTPP